MFEKIEIFDKRYSELNTKIYEPSVAADVEEYQKIMKEIRELEPVVLKYREYKDALSTID
jgi:peptide chain release factor 1